MRKVIILGTFINALGIIRALGKKKKYYVIAIGKDNKKNLVKWSGYLNEMVSIRGDENEIEILQKHKKEWENAYIIPTSDEEAKRLLEGFDVLSDNYMILIDKKTISNIIDKKQSKELCEMAKIPFPKFYTDCDSIEYPVIVKAGNETTRALLRNRLGKTILIVKNGNEFNSLAKDLPEESIIIQQYIPGRDLFFTGGYCYEGDIQSVFAAKKILQRPPSGGDTIVAKSIHDFRLIEYSRKLLKSIGYTGIFDIEYKYCHSTKDFYFIEMNPRSAKWIGFPESAGIPIIEQAIDSTRKPTKTSYKEGELWIDIHGMLGNLIQYPSEWKSIFKYIYYLLTADYFAVLDREDMSPFLRRR